VTGSLAVRAPPSHTLTPRCSAVRLGDRTGLALCSGACVLCNATSFSLYLCRLRFLEKRVNLLHTVLPSVVGVQTCPVFV
jgi:hypothetical protein